MAVRTFIPQILVVANYMKKYVNKNSTTLKERLGDGGYAFLVLIVDLLIIVAQLISAAKPAGDPWSDFNAINTLTSSTIGDIQAAIDKFYASIGVTP